jgi:hypothetical protein
MLLASAATLGCLQPKFEDCAIACSANGSCPPGMSCHGGLCSRQSCSRCDSLGVFAAPTLVPGLNNGTYRQGRARLSSDERTVILARAAAGDGSSGLDIVVAQRQDTAQPFGSPEPVANVNGPADEVSASMTSDGLTLYVESNVSDGYRIYVARRLAPTAMFSTPAILKVVDSSSVSEGGPYVVPNGAVYFQAYNAPKADLYRGVVGAAGLEAVPMTVLNTPVDDAFPVVSLDELTIYFSSTRADGALGGEDIWMATRGTREEEFSAPHNLTVLNTAFDERPTWISDDGCRLYFDRGGSAGGPMTAIYVAERTR